MLADRIKRNQVSEEGVVKAIKKAKKKVKTFKKQFED